MSQVSPACTGSRRIEGVQEMTKDDGSVLELTDAQCLSAAGALGVTLLMIFERHVPPHKRIAKKIKKVEEALLDLFHGCGEKLDEEIADYFCETWDKTMRKMAKPKKIKVKLEI